MPMTDNKENLKKKSVIQDLKTIKYITSNVKLNKGNKKVSALLDLDSEANLISQAYAA